MVPGKYSVLGEDYNAAIIFFRFGGCGFEVPGISIEFSTQGVYEQQDYECQRRGISNRVGD